MDAIEEQARQATRERVLAGTVLPVERTPIGDRLAQEFVVWLSTTRPDGRPHIVPVWFSWDGEVVQIRPTRFLGWGGPGWLAETAAAG